MCKTSMPKCYACGNDYDNTFTVTTANNETYIFDSFECAIRVVAPRCDTCDVTIIGHGVERNGSYYCCAHCARQ